MKIQTMSPGQGKGDTHALVVELVEVLRDELAAHHRILQLELAKREAIIARDAERLKLSAGDQAKELHRIDLLESRREKLAQRILPDKTNILLSQIIQAESVAAPEKQELSRYRVALASALQELRKVSDLNARLLADSRDLFKGMIMSLAGKGANRQNAVARPVLVDANC